MSFELRQGDALELLREMRAECVHCVVTSPPYWGLRDYGVPGQLGLEATPEEYVDRLVLILEELRRVLRQDGTLWLNLGDSYAGKDLVGVPWRVAFALRARGWWLRSDIVWSKPNPMPESVTDRPTKAHEYVFLLSRSPRYYYDAEAIRDPSVTLDPEHPSWRPSAETIHAEGRKTFDAKRDGSDGTNQAFRSLPLARNARTVWTMATTPFPEAHFATFPVELPERCIKAGSSERGCCPECGAPWLRQLEDAPDYAEFKAEQLERRGAMRSTDPECYGLTRGTSNPSVTAERVTKGWAPSCAHGLAPMPCTVLDPFAGAGTTLLVADRLGRHGIGFDLSPTYVEMARRRIAADAPLFHGAA